MKLSPQNIKKEIREAEEKKIRLKKLKDESLELKKQLIHQIKTHCLTFAMDGKNEIVTELTNDYYLSLIKDFLITHQLNYSKIDGFESSLDFISQYFSKHPKSEDRTRSSLTTIKRDLLEDLI